MQDELIQSVEQGGTAVMLIKSVTVIGLHRGQIRQISCAHHLARSTTPAVSCQVVCDPEQVRTKGHSTVHKPRKRLERPDKDLLGQVLGLGCTVGVTG